jgi:hypothetical protein
LKLFGTINGQNLEIRSLLDNAGLGVEVRGAVAMTVTMTHPSTISERSVTLELPTPVSQLTQDWQEL